MTTDARSSLSPLDPHLANHLATTIGPPESVLITRQGDRDIRVDAWTIGRGRTTAPMDASRAERGIDVDIRLTVTGHVVTTRRAWTSTPDGGSHDSQTGQVHSTPHLAYEWLLKDGKGKLGPASKQAWVQACKNVPPISGLAFESESGGNSDIVLVRLKKSDEIIRWVHKNLDGKKIPRLPTDKRVQLAAACWHVAIDHQMAVVVLVHETLHASALALMRPMIEACIRGHWLLYAATDDELDEAGMDRFSNDFFGKIVADLEQPDRLRPGSLSHMKGDTWKRLCSYTHTGYQQIGARLTPDGLGYQYEDAEILRVLSVADSISLMSTIELANLANDQQLRVSALERMRST